MFFSKKSLNQQLASGLMAPKEQVVPGLFGWTYQHLPIFIFETPRLGQPNWIVHFSHRCGHKVREKTLWVANQLDSSFSFMNGAQAQFCPHCVSLVDKLFAPNLAELGLENNYQPDQYFANLVHSFPYLFWNEVDDSMRARTTGYLALSKNSLKVSDCQRCSSRQTTCISHGEDNFCLRCASQAKLTNRALDDQSINTAFRQQFLEQGKQPQRWSEVQQYLPAAWGRLLHIFEGHQLPVPLLWQSALSTCEQHHGTLPIVWPELAKAVVMHPPADGVEWQDEFERWDFFTVLAQM